MTHAAKTYRMTLSSCGNPDFGENPNRPMSPTETVAFGDLADAGQHVRRYCDTHSLGGGNLKPVEVMDGNRVVARVSYNGRVWLPPADRTRWGDWTAWSPLPRT